MAFQLPAHSPIDQQVADLLAGRASLRDGLAGIRDRATAHQALNALAWVDWERAERAADDVTRLAGQLGHEALAARPLLGVFISLKDLFALAGAPLRAGTQAALPAVGENSAVAERLTAAGAIVFAKTNMHEVALGATGENSWTGDVCNPWDPARQAGGSSSGSAVAVACGIGSASIGSDTGGSVRIPAAFCGLVGFKPTWGAISLDGALPLSWTCDHAGPITRTVADAATLFSVLSGRSLAHGQVARRPRLGVPRAWLAGRLAPEVRAWFERHLRSLATEADLIDIDIPTLPLAWQYYTPIVRAEGAHVHRQALAAGGQGFSDSVLTPLQAGAVLPAAAYLEAMSERARFRADIDARLAEVDALVLPTTAVAPPLRGTAEVAVEGGTMSTREAVLGQTLPFSFVGLPTLSLPAGFVSGPAAEGAAGGGAAAVPLPMGMQVVARRESDASLLALGRWLEPRLTAAPLDA